MRKCPRCNLEKKDEAFGTRKQNGKIFLKTYCKECEKEYLAEYRKTHKRKYVYKYNKYEGVEK